MAYALVNILTLLRFLLSFVYVNQILLRAGSMASYFVLYALIVSTDVLDGALARTWGVQSKIGSGLDVAADLFFVLASSYALYTRGLFPIWMIVVIATKTAEFFITSIILKHLRKELPEDEIRARYFHESNEGRGIRKSLFVYDVLGRIVAAVFYFLPMLVLMLGRLFQGFVLDAALLLVFVPAAIAALLSSAHRISLCWTESIRDRKRQSF